MTPSDPLVLRRDSQAAARLTLNAPASRNSLSLAMLDALKAELAALAADRQIRAVILDGEGPAFCAGHDLKEIQAHRNDPDRGRGFYELLLDRCAQVMLAINALPQPVIGVVEGIATAAGCQLVAACDLAVAGEAARFCTPGVNLGLFCSTPGVALARNLSPKPAMEMLLLGEMVDAPTALRFGLINRVVPPGEALESARVMAEQLAGRSAYSLSLGKRTYYAQAGLPLANAYREAGRAMADNMLAADAAEGIDAFLTKRPPTWDNP
jgi:enoyl-CoA hydratase/carnithine racemase